MIISALSAAVILLISCKMQAQNDNSQWAIVNVSDAFLRAEPRYTSECVSQTRMGTLVQVLERKGYWVRIQTPEPYEGWVNELALAPTRELSPEEQKASKMYGATLKPMTRKEAEKYLKAPKYICIQNIPEQNLLMGNMVKTDTPAQGMVDFREWAEAEAAETDEAKIRDITELAKSFLGCPYLWGGMSPGHFDCSGLTGFCYFLNGILLPRDASQQVKCGVEIPFEQMQAGDLVYFMTMKKHIPHIRKIAGKEELPDVRDVIIMGGSRIAVRTAQLVPDYMNLKIIESDINRCNRLTELVEDRVMIINGDGRDPSLLMSEGIQHTEAFVALSDNSETNILACLAAKRFGVTKTIAEVENIDYINMAEKLDIGTVINKKKIAASHIYQMMLDADVTNVKCLTFANADVAEFNVMEGAKITRSLVKDISLPRGVTIGGLIRDKEAILVTGSTQILPGDHVVVFCLEGMIKTIEKYFN